MISRTQRALFGSILLLGWASLLTACGSDKIAMNEVQREDAERQALIEAMKHHPALANGDAEATGSPINVSTNVPPKPAGGDEHHEHPTPPQR